MLLKAENIYAVNLFNVITMLWRDVCDFQMDYVTEEWIL